MPPCASGLVTEVLTDWREQSALEAYTKVQLSWNDVKMVEMFYFDYRTDMNATWMRSSGALDILALQTN